MERQALLTVVVAAVARLSMAGTTALGGEEPRRIDYATSLKEALLSFREGMASDSTDERLSALKAILPRKKDIETLFPEHTERLWKMLGPALEQMLAHHSDIARELQRGGAVKEIRAIDVRAEKDNALYGPVLQLIAEDVPVFRAVTRHEWRTAGSSTYLFVNGRWILLRGFESIPAALSEER